MNINEKQLMQLMNQLRDHICLYDRLSQLTTGMVNREYSEWLRELRDELTNQQSELLRTIE